MRDNVNSALRRVPAWVLYVLAPLPVVWIYYLGVTGGLGVDPANRSNTNLDCGAFGC